SIRSRKKSHTGPIPGGAIRVTHCGGEGQSLRCRRWTSLVGITGLVGIAGGSWELGRVMVIEADAPIPDWPGLAGRRIALARRGDIVTSPLRQLFDWWQEHAGDGEAGGPPRFAGFGNLPFARIAPHPLIHAPGAA